MASDEQFSVNFWFREFPGWELASDAQKEKAREIARFILQPTRRKFGVLRITSWLRQGSAAHGDGGAVDFVAVDEIERQWQALPLQEREAAPNTARRKAEELAHLRVKDWMATHLVPARIIGELIAERDHVHVTRWGVGGYGEVWEEPVEGSFSPGAALGPAVALLLGLSIIALALTAHFRG